MIPTTLKNYFSDVSPPLFVLGWHLSELLDSVSYQTILDVDGSLSGVPSSIWKKDTVNTVIPFSGAPKKRSLPVQAVDVACIFYSLPFYSDPALILEQISSCNPELILTAEQLYSQEELESLMSVLKETPSWYTDRLLIEKKEPTETLLKQFGYYPMDIYTSRVPYPAHTFETTLYSKDRPDRSVYDEADYIVQVNSSCNFQCDGCYVDKLGETMPLSIYQSLLDSMHSGSTISIRGGEPTLVKNLIQDYIEPALNKGIRVILESNGSFIDKESYTHYKKLFQNPLASLRISLDKRHETSLKGTLKDTYIASMKTLFNDALALNFKLGFYALGMTRKQIGQFLSDSNLDELLPYVKPITKYHDISNLPINGRFVDLYGEMHTTIKGIRHSND